MTVKFSVDFSVQDGGAKRPNATYSLDRDLGGELTFQELLQFTKSSLIQIAVNALQEEQAKGFDKNPITLVDNSRTKALGNVNPFGKIEFASRVSQATVLVEVYQQIMDRSPSRTGFYKQYNIVTVNGTLIASNLPQLQAWVSNNQLKTGDIVRYINLTPYAGRLERLGVRADSQRARLGPSRDKRKAAQGVKVLIPNGVYFLTSKQVKRKFGANSKINFEWTSGREIPNSAKPTGRQPGRSSNFRTDFSPNKRGQAFKGPYVYPSIRIIINETGFL